MRKVMRPINKIIIQLVNIESVDSLIVKQIAEGMAMVGFHYMIEPDGTIVIGRPISTIGNHYVGENASSIGVAYLGEELTKKQESSIDSILEELKLKAIDVKDVFMVESGELKKYK